MTLEPQARLSAALADRYRIERELGAGGMATVYLAHDVRHDRKVALKVLKPELAAVVGADRFLAEIRTTANLQHPHILPLFDSGEADGFLFYVMPFVAGESLRDRLAREGELPVEEAIQIATAVAGALDYAHRQGVIHRDIKPENVLLHDGQPLVADFGIALAISTAGEGRLTETGLSLGTPCYMSPEQVAAERDPDPRSDVYSLGCVLYEMLTGEPPFTGASAQVILGKALTSEATRPTAVRSTIPDHVEAAVLRALEKRPADRFQTAARLVSALAGDANGMVQARHPRAGTRPTNRLTLVLAAATGVLGVALVLTWLTSPHSSGEDRVLRLPLTLENPIRSRSTWTDGIRIAPDGSKLAYYTSEGWRLLDLVDGTNRPVSNDVHGLHLAFSPGSDSVALSTTSRMQQVYVADLATGRASRIADCCGRISVWDDDGWVYHQDLELQLVRTRADGSGSEVVVPVVSDSSYLPFDAAPVPGGRGVVYARIPPGATDPTLAEIVVLDQRTGVSRALIAGVSAKLTTSGHLLFGTADGGLYAVRFDPDRLEFDGDPVRILDDVLVNVEGVYRPRAVFDVSSDGILVYVERRPLVEDTVVIVDREGDRVGEPVTWGGWVNHVARSADGTRWAASVAVGLSPPAIWVRDEGSPSPRRLTYSRNLDYYPRFTADGDSVLYVGFLGSTVGTNWDLLRVPFNGAGLPERILDHPDSDIQRPRLTAGGRWVVFCVRDENGETDILAHRFAPDSVTVQVETTPEYDCSPDVSPDGNWVTYESQQSGQRQLYLRPFPEAGRPRQITTDGGQSPRWSADGRELYYLSPENRMLAASVVPGSAPTFDVPRELFSLKEGMAWLGEVLPGGRFIMVKRQVEAPGQVIVIRNFFALLNERLGH